MCGILISGLANRFSRLAFGKSCLVHFGSFKRHILYFCASIVEKIPGRRGEVYEGTFVVSVHTNESNVAFNVVIWLSFLSIKFSTQGCTFFG